MEDLSGYKTDRLLLKMGRLVEKLQQLERQHEELSNELEAVSEELRRRGFGIVSRKSSLPSSQAAPVQTEQKSEELRSEPQGPTFSRPVAAMTVDEIRKGAGLASGADDLGPPVDIEGQITRLRKMLRSNPIVPGQPNEKGG